MKKINSLQINPQEVMKNEELLILKGGSEPTQNCCMCYGDPGTLLGYMLLETPSTCSPDCFEAYHHQYPLAYGQWTC